MTIARRSPVAALSLVVVAACASDADYHRAMETFYRAECARLGQGEAAAYPACRAALVEKRKRAWEEDVEEWHRALEERRKIEAEANR